jgi:hypothetical protein
MGINVAIFAGRQHHADKLMGLYDRFIAAGDNAEFIYTANSINIDPPAEYLLNEPVNSFDLRQLAPEADFEWDKIEWQNLYRTYTQIGVPLFEIAHATTEQYQLMCTFSRYIDKRKPDLILLLHENNFWTKTIAGMCNAAGIKCASFQEGILRDNYGFAITERACQYSDRVFVWSDYDKNAYVKHGIDKNKIIVGGPFHLDNYYDIVNNSVSFHKHREKITGNKDREAGLLALSLGGLWLGNIVDDIKYFCGLCKQLGVLPLVSAHPFDKNPDLEKIINNNGGILWKGGTLDAAAASNFVFTQYSTVAIEAALLNTRVFYINRSNYTDYEPPFFANIIDAVTNTDVLVSKIKDSPIQYRYNDLIKAYKFDGRRTDYVMEKLRELA